MHTEAALVTATDKLSCLTGTLILMWLLHSEKVHLIEAVFLCKHLQFLSNVHFCKGPNNNRGLNIEIAYICVPYLMLILYLISDKMYF